MISRDEAIDDASPSRVTKNAIHDESNNDAFYQNTTMNHFMLHFDKRKTRRNYELQTPTWDEAWGAKPLHARCEI